MSKYAGSTRLKMRLDIARKAIADLETRTDFEPGERTKLMELVERMTGGKYLKPGPRSSGKQSVFN